MMQRSEVFRFIKAQASSLVSSLVDYGVFLVSLYGLMTGYKFAAFIGPVSGGVVNFIIGRLWVFDGRGSRTDKQALRYFIVWIGNLLLNVGGVIILTEYFLLKPLYSKIIVSLLVGFTYNYFLQKKFVFK